MKISARNQLSGTVTEIVPGAVNGIVRIDIGSGNVITSSITVHEMSFKRTSGFAPIVPLKPLD